MKAVILAAGYATRLYPLTHDAPKHLLEVGGRPILDRLLEQLPLEELDTVYVITNAKFADRFREWAEGFAAARVEVVDDGQPRRTTSSAQSATSRSRSSRRQSMTTS